MPLHPALIVAYRQFLSWRTNWRQFLLMRLVEPSIFFYGIGLGFGKFIPEINGYPYITFLLPGSICIAAALAGMFEGTYNAFNRCYMQRTWFSFLATPARLSHIFIGEISWSAIRNLITTLLLIGVGLIAGVKLNLGGTLLALPVIILTVLCITSLGLVCMSFAKSMNDFDYLWALLMTPMTIFSGVMISIESFPIHIQMFAWFLPLTHALQVIRPLMLEGTLPLTSFLFHTGALAIFTVACLWLAHRRLTAKILA